MTDREGVWGAVARLLSQHAYGVHGMHLIRVRGTRVRAQDGCVCDTGMGGGQLAGGGVPSRSPILRCY